MTIYSRDFTIPASTTEEYELEIEGDVITYVRIRFPPGPTGLLKVAIFYGIKQIFPYEENTWFYGDDEIIEWQEYWELPEDPCRLIIKAVNEDDTYEHSFYLIINVQKKEQTLAGQMANQLRSAIKRMLEAESVEWLKLTDTSEVAAGSDVTTTVYAPEDYIYELLYLGLQVNPPAGATTGTHGFRIEVTPIVLKVLNGSSTYDTQVRYDYGYWYSANNSQFPTTEIAQLMAPRGLRIDENTPLKIVYYNMTDAVQTNTRFIYLWVRKIKVV